MSARPQFWFSLTSPYAYLTVSRIEKPSRDAGVNWDWQPIVLGPVFKALGWEVNPYADFPIKQEYMWRDVKRMADHYGLPFRKPDWFPQSPAPATKVALEAFKGGWGVEYSKAVYQANFGKGRDISKSEILVEIVKTLGHADLDVEKIILDPTSDKRIEEIAARALEKKLFGVPTFFVGDEMFWGNDRLEQAISWAAKKKDL